MSEMDWTVETESAVDAEMAALPVALRTRRVVVLHVFAKKTRRTPRRALAIAQERMSQVVT